MFLLYSAINLEPLPIMPMPERLQEAIEKEIEHISFKEIEKARENLTEKYRGHSSSKRQFMSTEAERCAYLAARMPATYAVVQGVLEEVKARIPDVEMHSLLDVGSGPGTAMWAARDVFPEIRRFTLIERDDQLAAIGARLAASGNDPAMSAASWLKQNVAEDSAAPQAHDMVILSYMVGELPSAVVPVLLEKCWLATEKCLVVIEPGTPAGFERIRSIRQALIAWNAFLTAPCPHCIACPMAEGDWCHFSKRVERTSFHRKIKGGTLGYEDEKFSYIVASKIKPVLPQARVLRHPIKHSGHIELTLCTDRGMIERATVSKRTPEIYKQARKIQWGESFEKQG